MNARIASAVCAALLLLGLAAPPAPAKRAEIKATIVGQPYVVASTLTGLPVLISRMSTKRAGLKSPLGVVYVPRRTMVQTPDGESLPGLLRLGDRFKANARVTREARRSVYARIKLKRITVYRRAK